ncbi:MAG: phage major tail tube protein, partial [Pseudomonadota bacterium]
ALQKLTGSMKLQFPEPTVYQSMLNPTKVHQWQVHQKVDAYGSDGLDADASYTLVTTMGLRFSKVKADTIKLNDIQMIEAEFTLFRLRQTILASGDQLFSVDVMGNQVQVGNEDIWPN